MAVSVLRRRFTVEQYHRMAEAGIFADDDRVELLEGEIVEMTPIGSGHAARVDRLNDVLTSALGRRAIVRVQSPVQLGLHSEPQPDLSVLRRRDDFYARAHPEPADVLLVVEVADTSLEFDRTVKIPLYGRSGIREAWLLDLGEMALYVHRLPSPEGYGDVRSIRPGESLTLEAVPEVRLAAADTLG